MLLNFIKLAGWQLSGVAIGWMKIFPGWELSGWKIFGWEFSGWEFSWVGVVRVDIFWVGVFLGGNCPGGIYPGWEFSLVEVFQVGIIRVGVFMLPLYHLIGRDTGRLANEAFTSNPIVSSSKQ